MAAKAAFNWSDPLHLDAQLTEVLAEKAKAQEAAERLGLRYVYRKVGYGDLADAIRGVSHV